MKRKGENEMSKQNRDGESRGDRNGERKVKGGKGEGIRMT